MTAINVISMSNAGDLGYRALADVADAAEGIDYRIVGGHMVQLLIHVYPTPGATERSTADADAGINRATAAGQDLHRQLLERGYEPNSGNHYVRKSEDGGLMEVDLLVPHGTVGRPSIVNGRGFDAIPGLGFALNAVPLILETKVLLKAGDDLEFMVTVPDVEAALILKALAWTSREAEKDLTDISSLMEIIHLHKYQMDRWGFGDDRLVGRGDRRDAATALHRVVALAGRGLVKADKHRAAPARLAALIREHIPDPQRITA